MFLAHSGRNLTSLLSRVELRNLQVWLLCSLKISWRISVSEIWMLCFRMPVWNFDVQATKTRHSWTWNLINSTCQIKLYTMHLVLIYEISWSKLQRITPNLLLIFFVRNRLKKQPQEVFLEVLLLLWYPYLSYHVITTFLE